MKKIYSSRSWIDPRLGVAESLINGKGIFTNAVIKKNELLMVFGGYVVKSENLDERKYRLQTAFPIEVDTFLVLPVSDSEDTVDEYLNHSCNPTAWLTDEITVVARKDIKAGEEITLDAATWDMDPEWLFSENGLCYCNDSECRKTLSPTDYKNPILQKKYAGHFSPYIQKRIDEDKETR